MIPGRGMTTQARVGATLAQSSGVPAMQRLSMAGALDPDINGDPGGGPDSTGQAEVDHKGKGGHVRSRSNLPSWSTP